MPEGEAYWVKQICGCYYLVERRDQRLLLTHETVLLAPCDEHQKRLTYIEFLVARGRARVRLWRGLDEITQQYVRDRMERAGLDDVLTSQ